MHTGNKVRLVWVLVCTVDMMHLHIMPPSPTCKTGADWLQRVAFYAKLNMQIIMYFIHSSFWSIAECYMNFSA